jgi:prepilin-type N-terminal cleavage/methylation domain-containing protein/prepilin-type processing-associated H-X9-DG protein
MASARESRNRPAFTLVELLVVIGIIAVLIGILLPTLSSARRAAQAAKCGSALREIGNAFQLYAVENKGYYPPMRCSSPYRITFNSNPPTDYTLNKTNGTATQQDIDSLAQAMKSVLWGCPNFVPVALTSATDFRNVGGVAVVYTGYGMNGFPEYSRTYPKPNVDQYSALGDSLSPGLDQDAVSTVGFKNPLTSAAGWSNYNAGRWYKQKEYTNASERALVGDCRAYVLEALGCPSSASIPPQADITALPGTFWAGPNPGETSYDFYRHGKYPRHTGSTFDTKGGKVLFNVLFADGHVSGLVTREDGIKAARMHFPG